MSHARSRPLDHLLGPGVERPSLGPYHLVRELGKGGFAPVWLAREMYGDSELRTVAIKLFALGDAAPSERGSHDSRSTQPHRARVIEEARALCRVEHPNVVRFYALTTDTTNTVLGLVMEHLNGESLAARLERSGTMPIVEALGVCVAIASALAAIHHAGLIHRDVKPANIIETGSVYKLIDFGIAAADAPKQRSLPAKKPVVLDDLPFESDDPKLTPSANSANTSAGTLGYIDPASLSGAPTIASDLYSLGATLYECLTGEVPSVTASRLAERPGLDPEVLDGRAPAPSLTKRLPDAPEALVKLVAALLDPAPKERPRSAEAVAWEIERILLTLSGRERPLPPESVGPFRGLGRFEEDDRDVFFGRTSEIASCLELLRTRGLVALIGASGSGKSSLARAGAMPAVADGVLGGWPKRWDTVVVTPGTDPKAAILAGLGPLLPDAGKSPEEIVSAMAERAQSANRGLLLIVDQLEELVTVSSGSSRDFAVDLLVRMGTHATAGVRCLVASRRDLLDPLLALGDLGRVLTRGTQLVAPMDGGTWGDVLDHALGAYGYRLEDDALRAELLAQLKDTAHAMPLVQFALAKLWERRDKAKKIIPRSALDEVGGIGGALEQHAEASLTALTRHGPDVLPTARNVLLALTTPQGTRRTRSREELAAEGDATTVEIVLPPLERARLLVAEEGGLTLAHEALLTSWTRLRTWIAEAREDRLLADEIERDADAWSKQRADERVWRKRRLIAAEDLVRKKSVRVSESARAFVAAGRAIERRGKITIGAVAVVIIGIASVAGVQYVRKIKEARQLAEESAESARAAAKTAEAEKRHAEEQRRVADDATRLAEDEKRRAETAEQRANVLSMQIAEAAKQKNIAEVTRLQAGIAGGAAGGAAPATAPAVGGNLPDAPRRQKDR